MARSEATRSKRRPMLELCNMALAICILLVVGLVTLISVEGLRAFWPNRVELVECSDGRKFFGELKDEKPIRGADGRETAGVELRYRTCNRDLGGDGFVWVREDNVVRRSEPAELHWMERSAWGPLLVRFKALQRGTEVLEQDAAKLSTALEALLHTKNDERAELRRMEEERLAPLNDRLEALRLREVKAARSAPALPTELAVERAQLEALHAELLEQVRVRRVRHDSETLLVEDAAGHTKAVVISSILGFHAPNQLGQWERLGLHAARMWEFLSAQPRESNTEGGVFPAIFGTVLMVFLMTLVVVPLGVVSAVWLKEYARQGVLTRLVRICVNNLAGTPSIVFGVFGLGFFVYVLGGQIDSLFYSDALPTPTFGTGGVLWASLTLALLTLPVVIVAVEEGLAAVPRAVREGSLALGATRFETIRRVVLPASLPAILTGTILAIGRAAGEVAPLMVVGMVKLAPDLAVDGTAPFLHAERKFMHLGFHIYDVGFQSPDVEATKPLVFATTLLLIVLVLLLNIVAIRLRNKARRRYAGTGF